MTTLREMRQEMRDLGIEVEEPEDREWKWRPIEMPVDYDPEPATGGFRMKTLEEIYTSMKAQLCELMKISDLGILDVIVQVAAAEVHDFDRRAASLLTVVPAYENTEALAQDLRLGIISPREALPDDHRDDYTGLTVGELRRLPLVGS